MKRALIFSLLVSTSISAFARATLDSHPEKTSPADSQKDIRASEEARSSQSPVASDEIIVTARRRNENLQDVPISITAVSGKALAARGVRDALDLQYQTPSLSVSTNGASRTSVSYALRGQRSQEVQLLTDSPVGTYFAEVVMPRTYGFGTAFYDIQNVQVLKGVQGTLFGRNMTGGAVLVEPNHPDLNEVHVEGVTQYGNYNMKDLYGMINVPIISDVLAIRLAGKYRNRDGFTTDISTGRPYDNQNYYALRPSVELHLGRFQSYTVFDYLREREHGTALRLTGYALQDPLNGGHTVIASQIGASPFFPIAAGSPPQDLLAIFNRDLALGHYRVDYGNVGTTSLDGTPGLPYNNIKNWGISNKSTFTAGSLTVKNIFGYRKIEYVNHTDYDGSAAALILPVQRSRTKDVSEEFQIQGTPFGSRFQFTVGGYYLRESGIDGANPSTFPQLTSIGFASNIPPLAPYFLSQLAPFFLESNVSKGVARSYAFYGAGTYTLTESFKLSGGVRYNNDARTATVDPYYISLVIPGAGSGFCVFNGLGSFSREACAHTRTLKNSAMTWDATLQYEPTPDFTSYVSVRQGYRAGGFNLRAQDDVTFTPFQPEHVREYEVGLKNRFEMGTARLNTSFALFFQNYTNVQKQGTLTVGTQVESIVTNTTAQHDYGGELELNLVLPNGVSANAFYSYVDNKIIKGGNGSYPMWGIPHHQVGAGVTYAHDLSSIGTLNGNINATYRSSAPLDDFDAVSVQKGYALVNARIGVSDIAGTHLGAAIFANNITNKYYAIGGVSIESNGPVRGGINPGGGAGTATSAFGEPRTYGVELSFRF